MIAIRRMKNSRPITNQRGSVIVLVIAGMILLLGIAALAIDLGYLYTTRTELQNVADAAALAGARYLGAEYAKLDPVDMANRVFTQSEVYDAVQEVAVQNQAAKNQITIESNDVMIGLWDPANPADVSQTYVAPDAVRVIARRESGGVNGAIVTFIGRIFNITEMSVVSDMAIAALSGPAYVEEGELKTPFGLSENVFPNNCTDVIAFSPTTDSCAGWHNFFDAINANAMSDKLLGFIEGDTTTYSGMSSGPEWLEDNFEMNTDPDPEETPTTSAGDSFEFQGGTISSLFLGGYLDSDYDGDTGTTLGNAKQPAPMIALFDYFRYRDGDGDNTKWSATIPVYKDSPDGCENPNTSIEIVGFAKIEVFTTDPPPLSSLNVLVDCQLQVIDARGGGSTFGNLKGTIPNLVK
jgi:Flp pilus assembly protein TadG